MWSFIINVQLRPTVGYFDVNDSSCYPLTYKRDLHLFEMSLGQSTCLKLTTETFIYLKQSACLKFAMEIHVSLKRSTALEFTDENGISLRFSATAYEKKGEKLISFRQSLTEETHFFVAVTSTF